MQIFKKTIQIIQEDIVGTDNRFIAMAWLACLSGLVGLGVYLSSETMSFLGVADSRELQINFEYPVEIKRIHVIPGQLVKKGDLLLELNQSELNGRIRLVRSQLGKLQAEMKVRNHLNSIVSNSSGPDSSDPLAVDIRDLTEELEYLENQKKNLYIFAEVSGIVGGVNFKRGEKVPSFTSVVTLSPENPTYVEGFVHENLHTKLEVGKRVTVIPVSSETEPIEGKIVSVGARIVLIPPRLMPNPMAQAWGREVVVEIPRQNGLLLGEKVQIKPKTEIFTFPLAIAATGKAQATPQPPAVEPQEMKIPDGVAKRFAIEPSGAVYLDDLKQFLVVSDDTDKKKSPSLFLVDREGRVDDQVLLVPGLDKISDLESISQSDGFLYLLTSQGLNKKGKDKKNRNVFVRVKRSGLDLTATESVEFKEMLVKAVQASKDAKLKAALPDIAKGDFEIEGHFVEGNEMFLGFKTPLTADAKTLILSISDVDSMFKKRKLDAGQVKLWRTVDFGKEEGSPHRLSDLVRINGRLYAATVCDDETCGAVWKLVSSGEDLVPERIKFFPGLKPEGLAFDSRDSSIFVTFDLKDQPAKFTRLPLQTSPVKSHE